MKKDQHFKIRTTQEFLDRLDELVEHYKSISIGTINKTVIVELAISELHKKMEQTKEEIAVK